MIQIVQGFRVSTRDAVDNRILLSYEEMRSINVNQMPSKYFAVCKDDGELYLYDANATASELTGKFRKANAELQAQLTSLIQTVTDLDEAVETINARLDGDEFVTNADLNKKLPGAIAEALQSPETKKQMEEAISGTLPGAISEAMKDPSSATAKQLTDSIAVTLPNALKTTLNNQEEDGGLMVDENGNIKVALNDEHLQIIDKKIDIAISVIEAIDGN